ncbi:WGxxGxxG family protein [Paenibacillus sp. Leaf72]|uniref:WGxxGxxG family protein n=1 Tax=Paenibacillus sp. Leaf72 TaxID=1736234 RepID=UPI0006F2CDC6|nr:WGxxGxxG family protein [Paenibacillus sp. Leaf72]KQO04619.1 hypothetical protein ASF12_13905 [Paenibacillus sp. Leaf72]
MKKLFPLLFTLVILSSALSIPAFAQGTPSLSHATNNSQMNSYGTNNNTEGNTNLNANNYRTNATTDDNDFDWGWLGLLGLAGLFGLRSRDRERT